MKIFYLIYRRIKSEKIIKYDFSFKFSKVLDVKYLQ